MKKKELSYKRRQNYQSLDGTEKKKITSQTQRKIPIYGCDKEERIQKRTEKYESMDTEAKRDLLNKIKEKKESKTNSHLLNRVLNSLRGKNKRRTLFHMYCL